MNCGISCLYTRWETSSVLTTLKSVSYRYKPMTYKTREMFNCRILRNCGSESECGSKANF